MTTYEANVRTATGSTKRVTVNAATRMDAVRKLVRTNSKVVGRVRLCPVQLRDSSVTYVA